MDPVLYHACFLVGIVKTDEMFERLVVRLKSYERLTVVVVVRFLKDMIFEMVDDVVVKENEIVVARFFEDIEIVDEDEVVVKEDEIVLAVVVVAVAENFDDAVVVAVIRLLCYDLFFVSLKMETLTTCYNCLALDRRLCLVSY